MKPKNVKAERVDRRIAENQTGKRMAVMTLRERDGRTVSAAVPGERGADFRTQSKAVLASALGHPVSRDMCGYWQRTEKKRESLVAWSPTVGLAARLPS